MTIARHGATASRCSGQPFELISELHFSGDDLRDHRQAVLDTETLDITVLQLAAVVDQRLPRRMNAR